MPACHFSRERVDCADDIHLAVELLEPAEVEVQPRKDDVREIAARRVTDRGLDFSQSVVDPPPTAR